MSEEKWLTINWDEFIKNQKTKLIEKRDIVICEIEKNNPLYTKQDLSAIDFSLLVIKKFKHSYPFCNICGVPIELKRLECMPEIRQCSFCFSKLNH